MIMIMSVHSEHTVPLVTAQDLLLTLLNVAPSALCSNGATVSDPDVQWCVPVPFHETFVENQFSEVTVIIVLQTMTSSHFFLSGL